MDGPSSTPLRLTYYTPAQLRPVIKTGDHMIELVDGVVYTVIVSEHGLLVRRLGKQIVTKPTLIRWREVACAFALVDITPHYIGEVPGEEDDQLVPIRMKGNPGD